MDERERFIRGKYERRMYYGAPSLATLRAACEDMEMRIETLPQTYMEGVDLSPLLAPPNDGSSSPNGGANNKPNPALARRQAKKVADEEADRAKRDAEEARVRAAMEAEQAAAGE